VPVRLIRINETDQARREFTNAGISDRASDKLLYCDIVSNTGLVPYGFNRNTVLIHALLEEVDVLFYIDDDVAPYVLQKKGDQIVTKEVDHFGTHLKELEKGADITTSDYSGYNILPYAHFDGMEELLTGLQKENMMEFWRHASRHNCLFVQHDLKPVSVHTTKVIGGNMALDLRKKEKVLPFFSPIYKLDDETFLARGEDTLIAVLGESRGVRCVDVDMFIFHDTYGDYPQVPSLENKAATQERFFYACTGWIGRNPFLNYILGNSLEQAKQRQRANLYAGVQALIKYTENERYSVLPRAFEAAWNNLPQMVLDYHETMDAWDEFMRKFGRVWRKSQEERAGRIKELKISEKIRQ
jgi:hypothetical protein